MLHKKLLLKKLHFTHKMLYAFLPSSYYSWIVDNLAAAQEVASSIYSERHASAFMLSFYASMGTFGGGLLVVAIIKVLGADTKSKSTERLMGVLQAFSAGVMLFITCFHLVPESVEDIGQRNTMICFFLGMFDVVKSC